MARAGVCGVMGTGGSLSRVKLSRDIRRDARAEEDSGGISRLRISMLLFMSFSCPCCWLVLVATRRLGLERRLLRVWVFFFMGVSGNVVTLRSTFNRVWNCDRSIEVRSLRVFGLYLSVECYYRGCMLERWFGDVYRGVGRQRSGKSRVENQEKEKEKRMKGEKREGKRKRRKEGERMSERVDSSHPVEAKQG